MIERRAAVAGDALADQRHHRLAGRRGFDDGAVGQRDLRRPLGDRRQAEGEFVRPRRGRSRAPPRCRPATGTGAPAWRRRIRWRRRSSAPAECRRCGRASGRRGRTGRAPPAAPAFSRGLISTRWTLAALRKDGFTRPVRSMSAISVPRPGPSSARTKGSGEPSISHTPIVHRPISSPKIWLISGAVMKSPARPKGSPCM